MRVIIGWASVSLATVVILGMAALWYYSYLGNKQLIADFNSAIGTYKQQVASSGLTLNPVQDARLDLILPSLQTLRTMPAGYDQSRAGTPWSLRFGLYQGDKLGADADTAYRRALNGLLLPRLLYRIESQLRANLNNPEFVYQALKVYLMLGVQGPLDKDFIAEWMNADWNQQFPGAAMQSTRDQLAAHLNALLEQPLTEISLDGNLVKDARRAIEQYPVSQRAYTMIKQTGLVRDLPSWRVADHVGPQGAQIILLGGSTDLSGGVPGLYTYEGFHNAFLPALADVAPSMARDGWIMGAQSQIANDDAAISSIMRDVISIYVNDYVAQWTQLYGQIGLVTPQDKQQAAAMTNILAGPTSPLKNVLSDIARQSKLTAPAQPAGQTQITTPAASDIEKLGKQELQRMLGTQGRGGYLLSQLFLRGTGGTTGSTGAAGAQEEKPPEERVEERLKYLIDYVNGSPAPIDEAIQAINAVYLALNNALNQFVPNAGPDAALNAALSQLNAAAQRAPTAVGSQLKGLADRVTNIEKGAVSGNLNDAYQAAVVPLCSKMIGNRYPMVADSGSDVTLDDFGRIFSAGGVMDSFFNTNLAQYVDMSGRPWRAQGGLAISAGALEQFRIARLFRDAMFASGNTPSARFEITPLSLDNAATQVLFEFGGQSVTYSHGPSVPVQMQWPGPGPSGARLSFQQPGAPDASISMPGPWALFRLFDKGQISPGTDTFTITFFVGGHSAAFLVRPGSAVNPFSLNELHKFRCPGKI